MSVIKSLKQTSTKAKIQGEHYLETTKSYYELKVFQQLTHTLSIVMKLAIVGGLLFLALVFALVGATIALGNYLDSMALSSVAIAFCLVIMGLMAYFLRKRMDKKIIRKVGAEFFED